mgnify:CR=1 FL=1
MTRLPSQPRTLSLVPVEIAARTDAEALALANGRDLLGERLNRWARLAGLLVALAFVLRAAFGADVARALRSFVE